MEYLYCAIASRFTLRASDIYQDKALIPIHQLKKKLKLQSNVIRLFTPHHVLKHTLNQWRKHEATFPTFSSDTTIHQYIQQHPDLYAHDILSPLTGELRTSAAEIAYVHRMFDPRLVIDNHIRTQLYIIPFLVLSLLTVRRALRRPPNDKITPSKVSRLMTHRLFLITLSALTGAASVAAVIRRVMKQKDIVTQVTQQVDEIEQNDDFVEETQDLPLPPKRPLVHTVTSALMAIALTILYVVEFNSP